MPSKTKVPGQKATALGKDPDGFDYIFYVPKTKTTFTTINYVIPGFDPNHTNHNNAPIRTIEDNLQQTLHEYNDSDFNEELIRELFQKNTMKKEMV